MLLGIIRALSLQHGVDDTYQRVGHMRERNQMVFASLPLAVIDRVEHRIEATGGEGRILAGC